LKRTSHINVILEDSITREMPKVMVEAPVKEAEIVTEKTKKEAKNK
jgi:hypothetical protein